jgi:hypothetical protein
LRQRFNSLPPKYTVWTVADVPHFSHVGSIRVAGRIRTRTTGNKPGVLPLNYDHQSRRRESNP